MEPELLCGCDKIIGDALNSVAAIDTYDLCIDNQLMLIEREVEALGNVCSSIYGGTSVTVQVFTYHAAFSHIGYTFRTQYPLALESKITPVAGRRR